MVPVPDRVNVTFAITELGFRPFAIDAKPTATPRVLRVSVVGATEHASIAACHVLDRLK